MITMRGGLFAGWTLSAVCAFAVISMAAQQDEGPILTPKKAPSKATSNATLLVICDLACSWRLDGETKGRIDAGGSAKAKVELGQHIVVATSEDGADQVKQISEVKGIGQMVVNIELQLVRDARLEAERDAQDREKREQQERESQARSASSESPASKDVTVPAVGASKTQVPTNGSQASSQAPPNSSASQSDVKFAVIHLHKGFGQTCKGLLHIDSTGLRYACLKGELYLNKSDVTKIDYYASLSMVQIKTTSGLHGFQALNPDDLNSAGFWARRDEILTDALAQAMSKAFGVAVKRH